MLNDTIAPTAITASTTTASTMATAAGSFTVPVTGPASAGGGLSIGAGGGACPGSAAAASRLNQRVQPSPSHQRKPSGRPLGSAYQPAPLTRSG